jgi:CheY-like chemotaxis protein
MRKAKTILIAESDENNYRLLEEILVVLGFKVLQASNSKSIIEVMKSNGVDMLIIDMLTPGMQGRNTIKKLRAINSNVKIVGHVAPSQAGFYKDVGIDDFLAQPCNGKDLSALVEKYFFN